MAKANTDILLTERISQLEEHATKIQADMQEMFEGQAEMQEMLKQLLLGPNTGAKALVAVPNCACFEEIDDVKEGTLYFRVGGGKMYTRTFVGIEVGKWFAIPPPRDCVDSEGCIPPYFKELPCDLDCKTRGLAIGTFIFLVSDEMDGQRDVHYLDTQHVKEAEVTQWKKVHPLVGERAQLCHFLAANDRIYAFGFVDCGNTLCVSYFDCQVPNQGWKDLENPVNVGPCSSEEGRLDSFSCILASTIKFVATDGKPGKPSQHALIFSHSWLLTYDFDDNSYKLSELPKVFLDNDIHCSVCPVEGPFYILIRDFYYGFSLVVYNHDDTERGYNLVFGLDDYVPEDRTGLCKTPTLRLVHLGNQRMCLVWPRELGACNIEVQCTKFIVEVLDGKYHATNVSSQVYTVEGFSLADFEAVVL